MITYDEIKVGNLFITNKEKTDKFCYEITGTDGIYCSFLEICPDRTIAGKIETLELIHFLNNRNYYSTNIDLGELG